ncbi:MAG TPA: trypsin-like peptidase domain-containing protein [Caproiciproducens sp.]|nr:trypsin-like peptidase domain-containing protein [Caproiciproducens sp.]
MSENDFNYNPNEGKDPLNENSESREPDSKPEEPASDTVSEDTKTDSSSEDTPEGNTPASSGQEEPKENPYQQQYQNPYSSYGQNQSPYGQNQNSYGQNQNPYGQNSYGQNQSSYGQGQNSYGQNQNSYGQSQNPYGQNQNANGQNQNPNGQSPYGQYRNPYGTYNNPYGSNGSSYGYGQNQNHQQPYWSYQPYGGQYQPQNPQQPKPPKKNRGLRVFLWILGILAVGTVTAFSVYSVLTTYEQQKSSSPNTASSQAQQPDNGASKAGGSSSSQAQIEGKAPGNGTNPNSSGIVINQIPGGSPLSAKEVYKKVAESVVGVETQIDGTTTGESGESQGTGIVATSDGYILTNAHVVNYSRANKVRVILHNSKQYAATVVGYDKTSDLAVLRINAANLTPAEFGNSDQLEVGDAVVAIGNPGGMDFASSLTGGMVSAVNRSIESHSDNGMTYIQTDAAINPGNSGGPLVDMYGQVIGINSNKIVATGYEGMGFSIPISKAKSVINDLIAHGYVSGRSRLGITAMTITEIQSQLSGYPTGVLIREIGAESDLKKSGVVSGDIITKADGQKVTSMEDLYAMLNKHKAGDTITLTIYSPGTSQTTSSTRDVKTKLLEDKGETQAK